MAPKTYINFPCVPTSIINSINMVHVEEYVRITPKLYNKHVLDRKNGEVTRFSLPVEKIVIIIIEPFV